MNNNDPRNKIAILDMTPVAHYPYGPKYKFSEGGLPSRGVRVAGLEEGYASVQEAYDAGVQAVRDYEAQDRMGNFGLVLGVTAVLHRDRYRPVINTFHSST